MSLSTEADIRNALLPSSLVLIHFTGITICDLSCPCGEDLFRMKLKMTLFLARNRKCLLPALVIIVAVILTFTLK